MLHEGSFICSDDSRLEFLNFERVPSNMVIIFWRTFHILFIHDSIWAVSLPYDLNPSDSSSEHENFIRHNLAPTTHIVWSFYGLVSCYVVQTNLDNDND
jgi:hypothetical protein